MLPFCLEGVWLGLAAGSPFLPFSVEYILVAIIGVVPWLWMQWTKPFNIFSLLFVAIAPDQLTEQQRQILTAFQSSKTRLLAIASAIIMLALLWQIYRFTPLAVPAALVLQQHWLGLLIAAFSFLFGNLFLQVPLSVLGVLLTSPQKLAQLPPIEPVQVPQKTTLPGLRVRQILPPMVQ